VFSTSTKITRVSSSLTVEAFPISPSISKDIFEAEIVISGL
jgi:hypothetical protein